MLDNRAQCIFNRNQFLLHETTVKSLLEASLEIRKNYFAKSPDLEIVLENLKCSILILLGL